MLVQVVLKKMMMKLMMRVGRVIWLLEFKLSS